MSLPTGVRSSSPTTYLITLADGSELSIDLMLFPPYKERWTRLQILQAGISTKESGHTLIDILTNRELFDAKKERTRIINQQDAFVETLLEIASQLAQINIAATSSLFQQATTRFFCGNLFEAVLILDDKAIEDEAQQSEQHRMRSLSYYRLKAQMYLLLNEPAKAVVYCEKLILIYPSSLTYQWYADILTSTDPVRALSMYQEAIRMCSVPEEQIVLLQKIATLSVRVKQWTQATAGYQHVLNLYQSLAQQQPGAYQQEQAETMAHIADVLLVQGAHQQGITWYNQAVSCYDRLSQNHPGAYKTPIAAICYQLGLLYTNLMDYPKAQTNLRKALLLQQQSLDTQNGRIAYAHTATTLARVYFSVRDFGPAADCAQKSFEAWAPLTKEQPALYLGDFFQTINLLARIIAATQGTKQANPLQQYSRQIAQFLLQLRKTSPPTHP